MFRVAVAIFGAVLLVLSLGATPAVAASAGDGVQTPDRFDTTTVRITLYENGSATWAIEHFQPLTSDNETERFRVYASNFEASETPLYRNFADDAQTLTRTGTTETDRQMEAQNFDRSAGVEPGQNLGVVEMSFRWTNFSRTYSDRLVVSDVFDEGFYIADGQRLVFEDDTSLSFAAARPSPTTRSDPNSLGNSGSITYVGAQTFTSNRPYVELRRPSQETPTENDSAGSSSTDGRFWPVALAVAVIALGVVAVGAWRSGTGGAVTESDDDDSDTATAAAPDTTVDEAELLDDNDRVIRLLEENGGRMKQVDIVEDTDWSKSKVSMLLSEMEEDSEISKLRVGRENIISLAGEEPDAAGSPFDEE